MDPSPAYPSQWETHAVLKDGSTVELRPIKPADRDALQRFHGQQSRESIYFRFFRYRPELPDAELDHFTQVDYRDRMAFVAMLGSELVAVARYERWEDGPVAEVAFFVHDDHHGKGLGTLMLEYLAAAARDRGLTGFTASVLPENYRMLGVFRSAGFDITTRFEDGVIEVELGIEVTPETSSAIADRHRRSTARSVARIVEPRTVAVIGASREPGAVGHELFRHLTASRRNEPGRGARVVAVNPEADEIAGVISFPTIAAAAEALAAEGPETSEGDGGGVGVDLAVIAVRAELVVDIVIQCAEAGVRGLLVISAGFAELDEVGAAREREVVEVARDNGMRLIGPAAFGLVNTDPDVDLSALYHPVGVSPGRVALASQSGPLGAALLASLRTCGVGISSFVGIGNRADVSVNDLLDYWALDPNTDVVVLYVENFGNLRNFSTVARRTSITKPIITIRPSSADQTELLRQAGVILVDGVSQLVEQANMAVLQPPARGNRVAIVANAASLARLAGDACRRQGLEVVVPASVSAGTDADSVLIGNLDTVSLRPSSDPDAYERVVVAAAVSDEVDLVMLALAPTAYLGIDRLAGLLDRVNRSIDKPIVAIGLIDADDFPVEGIPIFTFPEEAAQVLGRHASHGQWRAARADAAETGDPAVGRAGGERPPGLDEDVDAVIDRILAGRDQATLDLASPDLPPLVDALGIPLAPWGAAHSLDDIVELADRIGYPVVLKAANTSHRSIGESGGAAIDLHDREALVAAHGRMSEQLGRAMRTSVVQRMIPSTGIVRLELLQDPTFGAMLAIGLGGSAFADVAPVARRFLPVDGATARELVRAMVDEQAAADLEPAGEDALVELAFALARAASAGERLARISLNPILLSGADTVPTDVEIALRRRPADLLADVRHI